MKRIIEVISGSIAAELGILPGDILLRINGKKIRDVLDYRFAVQSEELLLEIEKAAPAGEIWELEIEKDADEDLGLVFKNALMSPKRRCKNRCIFCFIDQQPPGLRRSLYFKDDDPRLSFLHGNYVTLTNLSGSEIHRLANFHLSPLRISVHAADPEIRKKMTRNKNADNLFEALKIFGDAGISMHFQAVLCKGINDGDFLSRTVCELSRVKGAQSLAIVPAGITRHRSGLFPLEPFTPADAREIITQIEAAQKTCRETVGKTFVFASDEWYILAGKALPSYIHYEDFPQLDNGVGMVRLFEWEFMKKFSGGTEKFSGLRPEPRKFKIGIVTGRAGGAFMRGLGDAFEAAFTDTRISVHEIRNDFFGEGVTVSGLLTGADIIAQLRGRVTADVLFLPENAFRAGTEVMLDGTTRAALSAALGVPVKIGPAHGGEFFDELCRYRARL